jgi:hypothetical protein
VAPLARNDGDEHLTGRDIYARMLENRFRSWTQETSLRSGDLGGNEQETKIDLWFESFRGPDDEATNGVLSKTLVKYTAPFDIRYTGYLVVHNEGRDSDQFIYLASQRRVRRVNLRGEAVFGTDFSVEDIVPRELEHATYERSADALLNGVPCFVVIATPNENDDSDYSRFEIYVEKERFVGLQTRYWDTRDVEVKIMDVERSSLRQVEHAWIPMRFTMYNLRHDTFTVATVGEVVPNPRLHRRTFEVRNLESH